MVSWFSGPLFHGLSGYIVIFEWTNCSNLNKRKQYSDVTSIMHLLCFILYTAFYYLVYVSSWREPTNRDTTRLFYRRWRIYKLAWDACLCASIFHCYACIWTDTQRLYHPSPRAPWPPMGLKSPLLFPAVALTCSMQRRAALCLCISHPFPPADTSPT